ncbi:MAG: sugar phosphate isomerase/epimerase [Chitinophagaceae bacterium]|nr:sugar phosphate isomerase/epimerase [Chitinophagaceae bacterium]MBL0131765.1 sugar phosphate isomerase/epimerase [Chitinophagaceae bacterium]
MKKYFFWILILFLSDAAFSQNQKEEKWKLSIQTWTFHKYSFFESVSKARELDVKYLEVYPGQKLGHGDESAFSYKLTNEKRDHIKKYLKQVGVTVIALGVIDKDYYTKDNLEKFFEFAKYMGISFITAEPEWEDLDEFNRLARQYQVKVALHCHPKPASHYWHPDSTLKALQGRAYMGAWPDIGHWARNGVNIREAMKKMEGKIWGLHFKDVKEFGNVKTEDTLFGKGVCDLPAVVKELRRQKFTGVISMEYEANENDNMKDMIENTKFYLEQIKRR